MPKILMPLPWDGSQVEGKRLPPQLMAVKAADLKKPGPWRRVATFRNIALRVWRKVAAQKDIKACWPWTGAFNPDSGYGFIRWTYRHTAPHRIAYEWVFGPIPDNLFVLHKCDNPLCCNPNHLRRGTQRDNMRDCYAKGRGGDKSHPRLQPEQVTAIRQMLEVGVYVNVLAAQFGVALRTIYRIKHGDTFHGEGGTILQPKNKKKKPRTHCKRGHELTDDNTYRNSRGDRNCRICLKAYRAEFYKRQKLKALTK